MSWWDAVIFTNTLSARPSTTYNPAVKPWGSDKKIDACWRLLILYWYRGRDLNP
nr:hypothetical protein [Serratia sp. ATCC 39006]